MTTQPRRLIRGLLDLVSAAAVFLCGSMVAGDEPVGGGGIDFNRDIRPLLAENCFHCHGPDAAQRKGELRLDERAGAMSVIQPGSAANSRLYQRIMSEDPELLMPPPESGRVLSADQRKLIGRWLDGGAVWGEHWSWQPLVRPPVPDLFRSPADASNANPIRNSIDAFIQSRLAAAGLSPSPEASRASLIRRLSMDLTGLPPAPAETAAFVGDTDPGAYERLVDRLLASPHYGERMAWEWLDAARYADSNGYQGDSERTMWPWRDWVVGAFNRNLPWDQFTLQQLAGDLLPNAGESERLATAFCRNHMINGEGGRIAEENRVDYVLDMTETTGTLWLGLTLNCCRCHDHKFDALTQRDYYSFFAFFNQTPVTGDGRSGQTPPVLQVATDDQRMELERLESHLQMLRQAQRDRETQLEQSRPAWELQRLRSFSSGSLWRRLSATKLEAEHQHLGQRADLSIFADGPNPANDAYRLVFAVEPGRVTGLRLEALRDPTHTQGGLARSDSGNFVLTDLRLVRVRGADEFPVKILSAEATHEQGDFKVTKVFDGDRQSGWAVYEGRPFDRDHAAVFRFEQPLELLSGDELRVELRHDSVHVSHNLGLFALSVTQEEQPSLTGSESEKLRAALSVEDSARSAEQRDVVRAAQRVGDAEHLRIAGELRAAEQSLNQIRGSFPQVMVMQDQPVRRETRVLNRGLYNSPADLVSAAVPASLPGMPAGAGGSRLDLAHWLVAPENPLTARVVVNRFWQQLFGTGLVKTANDFGVQGELPEHRELLDWLAVEFRDSGWDVKRLMRLIVMSHTYRQSSVVLPEHLERDPENRLLARSPRYRWPSWMLRDQALASSGLLTRKLGGPPVNVYQPPGVWEEATFGRKTYVQASGEALYRRSLYVFWRRIIGPTMFFDNASRQTCSVAVFRTNSPLHALATYNDTTWAEAARVMAQQVLIESDGGDRERLREVCLRVLARDVSELEAEILLGGLERARREFGADPAAAAAFSQIGESPRVPGLPEAEHAAWASLCLAVLNLDESLSRE